MSKTAYHCRSVRRCPASIRFFLFCGGRDDWVTVGERYVHHLVKPILRTINLLRLCSFTTYWRTITFKKHCFPSAMWKNHYSWSTLRVYIPNYDYYQVQLLIHFASLRDYHFITLSKIPNAAVTATELRNLPNSWIRDLDFIWFLLHCTVYNDRTCHSEEWTRTRSRVVFMVE